MVVTIYEGNDAENNGNEKALSAEASGLQWSSDGSQLHFVACEHRWIDDVNQAVARGLGKLQ